MTASPSNPANLREIGIQVRSNHGPDAVIEANSVGGRPEGELYLAELISLKARQLADLVGIILDLDFVQQSLDRLAKLGDPPADSVIAQALWGSALVAYARCFTGGKRAELKWSLFDDSPSGAREVHRFMMDMRDKHVAHAVNPFDQVHVGAVLSPPGSANRDVLGTVMLRTQLVGGITMDCRRCGTSCRKHASLRNVGLRRSKQTSSRRLDRCQLKTSISAGR